MKRKAWQKTVLDKNVPRRFKKLGDLGEPLAGHQDRRRSSIFREQGNAEDKRLSYHMPTPKG